jgi:hypothetical protein
MTSASSARDTSSGSVRGACGGVIPEAFVEYLLPNTINVRRVLGDNTIASGPGDDRASTAKVGPSDCLVQTFV